MTWSPKAEQRPHPFGESGVRSSLEEVAKRASGLLSSADDLAKVRTWSIEKLDVARKRGVSVHTPRARAQVLLEAVQQKLWVPDPIGVEYIPGAHLLACDEDGPDGAVCVKGDDCDGLVTLLAACYLSVGLYTMIAGHAYNQEKQISHVLTKVYFENKWHYADPSSTSTGQHFALGKNAPFTRERCYALPNVKVICDGETCRRNFNPEAEGFVKKGDFVGLSGLPDGVVVVEEHPAVQPVQPFAWLGGTGGYEVSDPRPGKLSTFEKIMLASVVISGLSLAVNILELKKKAEDL